MSDAWYYARDGKPAGPVSIQELRAELHKSPNWKEELVWNAGKNDWVVAGTVSELAFVPPPLPPPKQKTAEPPQLPSQSPAVTVDEAPKSRVSKGLIAVVSFVAVLFAAAIGGTIGRESVRAVMRPSPPSPAQVDQLIYEGLTKSQQQLRQTLPKKLNEWITMVDMTFSGRVVSYFYAVDDVRYDISSSFPTDMRKEVQQQLCAEKTMTEAMRKNGMRYRYVYDGSNKKRLAAFEFGDSDCRTN